jgi:hypothetical protein
MKQTRTGLILLSRGRSQRSIELIDAMYEICEEMQPITGRGVGYKLFSRGLIPSMHTQEMAKVYRLLRIAREEETIPWEWIVDESRSLERRSQWAHPLDFLDCALRGYRRDFWDQQPVRVEVWSEKGTVRGVLAPVLDHYGVGFRVMHGFSSATTAYEIAQDDDGRVLHALYVGDYDPSGLYMSEQDLPSRVKEYGGDHVTIKRIAITRKQTSNLPAFPAASKKRDPRHAWFTKNYGQECFELDAMDPRKLRATVENAIRKLIEPEAWARCERINAAERASLADLPMMFIKRHCSDA